MAFAPKKYMYSKFYRTPLYGINAQPISGHDIQGRFPLNESKGESDKGQLMFVLITNRVDYS